MPSAKELKDRIKAVKETRKITGAMYLISSTKLRRAKADLAQTRPYFDALREEAGRILRAEPGFDSRYFGAPSGAPGVLVITADKGLAGAYNISVIREAEELLETQKEPRLFVVGEYGRRYFAQHRPDAEYLGAAHSPTPGAARELCSALLEKVDNGELGSLTVVYTDMRNSMSSRAMHERLLPLEYRSAGDEETKFELVPSEAEVIRGALRSYITGFLYSALLDSFCAEQNARVAAMDSANSNAQELLGDLTLQLNRSRQAAITQEITEISAGAQAQKNKRKKGGASS
ncbi:MAG: ATP synthase F1 subunit gamma [Oscillospiraceae bacterium]|nr:ATP synthase F1 subunit gamma [Oscillospiraceae bacterium]